MIFKYKILSDSAIIDLYTKNFLCYNVNAESREGRKLINQYNAIGLPTIIYLSPTKDIINRSNGTDKVSAAAFEAIRVLKVMQSHQQVKRQAIPAQTASVFRHKHQHQKKVAIQYALKDAREGKTDIEKQVFEYTLNSSEMRTFKRVYIKTRENNN